MTTLVFSEYRKNEIDPYHVPLDHSTKHHELLFLPSAMAVSKELKKHSLSVAPRDVATAILAKIPADHEIIESLEIAGPGFVNVRLRKAYVADKLTKLLIKVHELR